MPFVASFLPSRVRSQPRQVVRDDRKQTRHSRDDSHPVIPHRPSPSPSLSSTETLHNEHDIEHDTFPNVSEGGVAAVVGVSSRHICNPRQCFKRASTSQTPSPSPEVLPKDFILRRSSSLDRASFTPPPRRSPKTILEGSPLTLSPRSSIEFDHDHNHQGRPSTASAIAPGGALALVDGNGNVDEKARKRTSSTRKAFGLFHRKKPSASASAARAAVALSPPGPGPLSSDGESPLPVTPPNAVAALPPTQEPLTQEQYANGSGSDDSIRRRKSIGGSESLIHIGYLGNEIK